MDKSIEDMRKDLSLQRLDDVKQFLMDILDNEQVTIIGSNLRWSLYSKYTPTIDEYHKLLSVCKFNQTMALSVINVLNFFSYHELKLCHTRIFELINKISKSKLLWSFLTLRRTNVFLREIIIQVGNNKSLTIPDMVKNLESILDDPSLVTKLLMHQNVFQLNGFVFTISYLSRVIIKDETSFKLHKFRFSSILKRGLDIDPEWDKLSKMEKMSQLEKIVHNLEEGFVETRGDHVFELFEEAPRHGVNNTTQLVRGDYYISDEGDVTIKMNGVELVGIKYICLPLDTLHMKKFSGSVIGIGTNKVPFSKAIGMNNIRTDSLVPLQIPVNHFPDFTLTNIEDVTFVPM